MTEIDLLKRVRDDVPDPDRLALARARQQLFNPPAALPPLRRTRPRLVLAGALAVTLAGGFLAADVITRDNAVQLGATADASTFLATAAARTGPDAPIPPGHFREIVRHTVFTETFVTNPTYQVTLFGRSEKWIPAAPARRYVQRQTKVSKVEFPTPAARAAAQKVAPYLLKTTKPTVDLSRCGEAAGGRCTPSWVTPTPEFLAKLPRDPNALLTALLADTTALGRPSPPNLRAFLHLSAVLNSGLVPADLRAALYQAAAKIPGIQLEKNVVTLDGRTGRAISLTETDLRHDIVISDAGEYIGERTVVVNGPGRHLPGFHTGDIVDSMSVTTRITATQPAVK
ncbi:hypothetical protein AB0E69_04110 [Kribbella sp. NPDC026611]|uniref:hypothetical protein n=1 Tax=Kribbella sp. NPDC026611 TaxID=3154911 RepID=UPI0033EF29E7